MNSSVPKRAEDVINTLIAVYEEDAIADKRQVSVVTNAFIKERMLAIGRELGVVDSEIEGIKKSNQMIDITSEATRSITESSKFKVEGLRSKTRSASPTTSATTSTTRRMRGN